EPLQSPFGNDEQADRDVEVRHPESGPGQVLQVVEVLLDVGPLADAPKRRNKSHGGVWLDHGVDSLLEPRPGKGTRTPRPLAGSSANDLRSANYCLFDLTRRVRRSASNSFGTPAMMCSILPSLPSTNNVGDPFT